MKLTHAQRNGLRGPRKHIVSTAQRVAVGPKIRQRPQRRTLLEIRKLQQQAGYAIPKQSFVAVVKQLTAKYADSYRFQAVALEVLQEAVEAYLVQMFTNATLLAEHGRRVTVMDRDITLLLRLTVPKFASCM